MSTIERILFLKNKTGLSDAEFERQLGLKEKTTYSWKANRSKSYNDMLPDIARVLETTASYLLGETDDPAPHIVAQAASMPPGKDYSDLPPEDIARADAYIQALRDKNKK